MLLATPYAQGTLRGAAEGAETAQGLRDPSGGCCWRHHRGGCRYGRGHSRRRGAPGTFDGIRVDVDRKCVRGPCARGGERENSRTGPHIGNSLAGEIEGLPMKSAKNLLVRK